MGMLPKPLSNEELAALRKKAQPQPQTAAATAEQVAYETGIKSLGPIVKRIETLEAQLTELKAQFTKAAEDAAAFATALDEANAKIEKLEKAAKTPKQS
jgi:exonuclease VII small subunit